MKRQTWKIMVLSVGLVCLGTLLWISEVDPAKGGRHLADGSWLKIREVVVAEEVTFQFPDGNWVQRLAGRIVPPWIPSILPWTLRSKVFPQAKSGLHMSGDGKVCLFIVTARDGMAGISKLDLRLLSISDDQDQVTNTSAAIVTVDSQQRFQGWAWEDFPKYSKNLFVQCWSAGSKGQLVKVAQFKVQNPGYEPEAHRKAM